MTLLSCLRYLPGIVPGVVKDILGMALLFFVNIAVTELAEVYLPLYGLVTLGFTRQYGTGK